MKLSKIKSAALWTGVIGLLVLTNLAFAQVPSVNIPGTAQSPATSAQGLLDIVKTVIGWVYVVFFILAALFILLAAFTYLTSGGDEEKVKTAKNRIIYAAVAVVVALLSVGFTQIIDSFVRTSTPQA